MEWVAIIALCCGGGFVVVAVFLIALYNRLVVLRNRVKNAWSQIDVQLRRRYDLIPNLVETVKGYAKHESATLEAVIKARQVAVDATGVAAQGAAENMLTSTLRSLFAVAEAYPELKANQNFMMLQEELSGTESKIAYARQFYNDSVMSYNTGIESFPANLVAGILGFQAAEYFEIEEAAKEPVKVQF
ncbi:MAG: LemA family protein [Actinobacteria bacterium]|nr:MAG: LemA family protein [Actinomycetota bacterium]